MNADCLALAGFELLNGPGRLLGGIALAGWSSWWGELLMNYNAEGVSLVDGVSLADGRSWGKGEIGHC